MLEPKSEAVNVALTQQYVEALRAYCPHTYTVHDSNKSVYLVAVKKT